MSNKSTFTTLDKPICFMHTFKTGGISFGNYLQDIFGEENTVNGTNQGMLPITGQRDPNTGSVSTRHLNYKDVIEYPYIRGHIPFSYWTEVPVDERPYLVTLLRDPVQRIVSYYHFMKSWKGYKSSSTNEWQKKFTNLTEFVNLPINDLSANLDNFQCKFFSGLNILDDEIDFDQHTEEEIFITAKANLDSFYLVGITELLDSAICLMSKRLQAGTPAQLYRENIFEENILRDDHRTIEREILSEADYVRLCQRNIYDIQLREYFLKKYNEHLLAVLM